MDRVGNRRRLTTILAADVAGFSNLMARNEEATHRTLRAHREVIDRLIERYDGRIFNTAGDSVLAEFGSAVEAVRCAIAVQEELRVRNAELVADRQMWFRIGINIGDVLVDEGNLLGDGVNVAARLESIAPAGGICISGSTFEQVRNKLSIGFESLGPQKVKNIPEPVAAFRITTAPLTVAGGEPSAGTAPPPAGGRRTGPPWLAAAVLGGLIAASAVVYWQVFADGPRTVGPGAMPQGMQRGMQGETEPDDVMRSRALESLVSGMTIEGIRNLDGQPFTIVFNPGRTLDYQFTGSGAQSGTTQRETGTWRIDGERLCFQVRRFAQGREICPTIVEQDGTLTAKRGDGSLLPWTLSR